MRHDIVRVALVEEIKEMMAKSKHYQEQIGSSKTRTKKNLMQKRLKQNNRKLSDLLVALDRLEKRREVQPNAPTNQNDGRAEEASGTEEPTDQGTGDERTE